MIKTFKEADFLKIKMSRSAIKELAEAQAFPEKFTEKEMNRLVAEAAASWRAVRRLAFYDHDREVREAALKALYDLLSENPYGCEVMDKNALESVKPPVNPEARLDATSRMIH